ncbi:haloacid dehalogenase type II [Christiangramia salexigens]|uniref:Haloacid dehalogenase, type II n=1 Tax=Christiangramia salexigens TaxID=1913577 RepID=A0A1L3J695_9FLAO|nr:haloacid dehalogenase type II [Christiangramia salexigens]APG60668.1 haloacid dehalogenase, type II [Christiangramia salexigens]
MENTPEAIFFDVNETLLDLTPLKTSINSALESEQAADVWFAQLLQYSLVENNTNSYHDFSEIAAAVFKMNCEKAEKSYSDEEIKNILSPVSKLNAYPEVAKTLKQLKEKGFKLIAFSNGKPDVLIEQLEYAGIKDIFDEILSVEGCKKYKPHSAAYRYALDRAGISAQNSLMVAAHGWDIAGAINAKMQTAFVKRPGKSLYPLAAKPDFEIKTLTGLLHKLM